MNTQKLVELALNGLDNVGFRLDQLGITGKVNRHNLAAFLFAEQKHLEGEWDSIQAKVDRRRAQFEHLAQSIESRTDSLLAPIVDRLNRFRASS